MRYLLLTKKAGLLGLILLSITGGRVIFLEAEERRWI
jgi:hypothetical protein